ncbi:MAG: LLM class flavin-dependent oxidoreductase [Chloroflexi bacterium]|nr:LLM class flavin-dependent oxidoreductase [Chloroflexota bacterium]
MQFGLFLEWPNAGARPWREVFEEGLAQVQLAERVGFDFCLIAEHHFSDYSIAPSPILEALAILRATTRIRVGTAVAVLPEWQPLRLAEEIAVADQLSGGRFIAGIGRGFVPFEQERFAVDVAQNRAHFDEALDVLLKAWTEDDFTYEGRFVRVPEPTTVWPRPLQKPHPPLWVAGSSAESVELVGRLGMTPITSAALAPARLAAQYADYVRARARHGRQSEPLDIVAQTHVHVADTEAEARAVLPEARWQRLSVPSLLAGNVRAGRLQFDPNGADLDDEELVRSHLFATPEHVVDRLRELIAAGVTHVSMLMTFGGLEHHRVMRSIELIGEAVIPALQREKPPRSLFDDALRKAT